MFGDMVDGFHLSFGEGLGEGFLTDLSDFLVAEEDIERVA